MKAANGSGDAEILFQRTVFPTAWSPDGRFIVFMERGVKTRMDLWVLPMFGDRKEFPLSNSPFDEQNPQLSPDGRWLAYTSDETGNYEVYVQSFSADGKLGADKKLISTAGGKHPVWRREGGELFSLEGGIYHEYDVSPDGQRFLIGTLIGETKAAPPTVILNWTALLKK